MKNSLIVLSLLVSGSFAFANGITVRGGGNAVVCRDKAGKIKSATMLDLYEAQYLYKLSVVKNDPKKSYMDFAVQAAKQIDKGSQLSNIVSEGERYENNVLVSRYFSLLPSLGKGYTEHNLSFVEKSMTMIQEAALTPIDDSNSIIKPRGCEIEQTAVFYDMTDELFVVEEIWNAFDNVNKAALIVHEAVYRSLRVAGESTSDHTRQVVAHSFGGSKFTNVLEGLPEEFTICGTVDAKAPKYRFVVYDESPEQAAVQFIWLDGKLMPSKTKLTVPKSFAPEQLPEGKTSSGIVSTFFESLFDSKLKVSIENKREEDGSITSSIGLIGAVITNDNLNKVTCNKASLRCDDKGCTARQWDY